MYDSSSLFVSETSTSVELLESLKRMFSGQLHQLLSFSSNIGALSLSHVEPMMAVRRIVICLYFYSLVLKKCGDFSLCTIIKDRNTLCALEKIQRSSASLLQLFCVLHATSVSLGSNTVKLQV